MLRIVKMTFKEEEIANFQLHFDKVANQIRRFEGCNGLSLVQDRNDPGIFFTISRWEGPDALDAYRNSDMFKQTWSKVKPLFREQAEAWSTDQYWENGVFS